jgi:hypothetical protein
MEAGRGTTGYRLIDRARRMVRESSPSVLAANLFAKMNTADAESMAQRRRSCRGRGVSECVGMAGNARISPKHSITCGIHRGAAGIPLVHYKATSSNQTHGMARRYPLQSRPMATDEATNQLQRV